MSSRRLLANAVRALSMDAVQRAASGHPGAPMGMADIAEVLWREVMEYNPANPRWVDRDRFVLSNGHASMLLYSVLHLTGHPLSLEDIKDFRQLGSRTAGHPEHDPAVGIETTTGPLGQGIATAVGMALAERLLAAEFNRPGHEIVDHHTYVFLGDGCIMEGISHEAASLAGTLGLGKLVCVWDDNGISIDGKVKDWMGDDTAKRFAAYGWQVIANVDGHDGEAIAKALKRARANRKQPTLICARTVIGYGAPNKQGTKSTHGEPLGVEEIAATRAALGWAHEPFVIPEEIRAAWDQRPRGARAEKAWRRRFNKYQREFPELAAEFTRRMKGELPARWPQLRDAALAAAAGVTAAQATRASSQVVLNAIGPGMSELLGGSADLTGSVNTLRKDSKPVTPAEVSGNYVYYGVREFAMTAMMNGLALHGGFIPYAGTFLVFSDYARNAVRLAALMHQRVLLVYTHDSIGLGEDGPTHQPVEHLASLRAMPNLGVWRPCDAAETGVAWLAAVERQHGPSCLVLTRQALPQQTRSAAQQAAIANGGYVLIEPELAAGQLPAAIVIATGSEVAPAAEAVRAANAAGRRVRLVSMPSTDVFDAQDAAWRDHVLPRAVVRRIAVEAAATQSWWKYVGSEGRVLGIDRFGASGKAAALFEHYGLTTAHIGRAIDEVLAG
ncbi:MAG: transketolase [Gammaproteobacteria bacterium]|nr:transketolase [Gammaproteobacteria bacterium]NDB24163.1 transketolase [Gammaproteobacteria bacterium]